MLQHIWYKLRIIITISLLRQAKKAILEDLDQTLLKIIWFKMLAIFFYMISQKVAKIVFIQKKIVWTLSQIVLNYVITVQLQHISDIFLVIFNSSANVHATLLFCHIKFHSSMRETSNSQQQQLCFSFKYIHFHCNNKCSYLMLTIRKHT